MPAPRRNIERDIEMISGITRRRSSTTRSTAILAVAACAAMSIAGCISVGPNSVPADRFNYSEALSQSFKQQMLLNIVRLRYGDMPVFIDVTSIVSGYTVASRINAGVEPYDVTGSLDVSGELRFEERPTISYESLGGGGFAAALLEPISVATIWSLIDSGWNAETLLRATTNSIGPIANRQSGIDETPGLDPRFADLVAAFRRLQIDGVIGVRQERAGEDASPRSKLLIREGAITPDNVDALRMLRDLLALPEERDEFVIQYDASGDPGTISFRTRSMLQILCEMAGDIEVPPEDITRGVVLPHVIEQKPVVRIHGGVQRPDDAFCAVRYRGIWFWIDDDDYASKGSFSFLTLIFQLKAGDRGGGGPVLTIPTQ
jgi:hypothetical protein